MEEIGVLIVDDDPNILKLAMSFLEREGMRVQCASNGEEALRMVKEKTFSFMITDLHMPGMKGIELAARVREIAPEMPIFMITGDAFGDILNLARKAGILKIFAKPLCFLEIMETVRGTIEERNARPGPG